MDDKILIFTVVSQRIVKISAEMGLVFTTVQVMLRWLVIPCLAKVGAQHRIVIGCRPWHHRAQAFCQVGELGYTVG